MKYFFSLLIVFSWDSASAQSQKPLVFEFSNGYQQENFRWSIAGNSLGENPNVYSELKWRQVGGPSLAGNIHWSINGLLTLITDYRRTFITVGEVSDFDYLGDNRTENNYRGYFNANKGSLQTFRSKVAHQIVCSRVLALIPAVGYISYWQDLYILDEAKGLQSTYFTNWKGILIGVSTIFRISEKMKITNDLTIQWLKFNAKANWNLVNTFQHPLSFEDRAIGAGLSNEVLSIYTLRPGISLYVGAGYYHQKTGKGIDQLYLANGETAVTQFNGAIRHGFMIAGGLRITLEK